MAIEGVRDVGQSQLTGRRFGIEAEADLPPRPVGPVEPGRQVPDQLEQRDAALSCGEELEIRTVVRSSAALTPNTHTHTQSYRSKLEKRVKVQPDAQTGPASCRGTVRTTGTSTPLFF